MNVVDRWNDLFYRGHALCPTRELLLGYFLFQFMMLALLSMPFFSIPKCLCGCSVLYPYWSLKDDFCFKKNSLLCLLFKYLHILKSMFTSINSPIHLWGNENAQKEFSVMSVEAGRHYGETVKASPGHGEGLWCLSGQQSLCLLLVILTGRILSP